MDLINAPTEQEQEEAKHEQSSRNTEAAIGRYQKKIDRAYKKAEKQHEKFKKWRNLVTRKDDASGDNDVKPHVIQSAIAALIPALYAKNPEIEIRPTAIAMQSQQAQVWQQRAATAEALIQQEFIEKANLKRRAKKWLRSCMTTGQGWLMVSWQDDFKRDPIQVNRLNDAQDNVARVREIDRQLRKNEGIEEQLREELHYQSKHVSAALNGERELYIHQGFVIDTLQAEDVLILDDAVTEIGDYLQANAIARVVNMTREDYKTKFNREVPETATNYRECSPLQSHFEKQDSDSVRVYEVWDKSNGYVFTFVDGAKEWARDPWVPQPSAERFYPFFEIDFNPVDGEFFPMSDVELLADLQKEYHVIRTQQHNARIRNKPKYVVNKQGQLDSNSADKMITFLNVGGDEADYIAIDAPLDQAVGQYMQQMQPIQYNQALWDPSQNARDIEMLTRSGDASRGFVNKAKTATEAEIMSMGMQSGVAERQDIIEETMAEMATYALQIIMQIYTPEMVANALGGEHSWQQVNIDVAFQNLNLDIKAGSMSKPNKFQEREQWMQLMPQVQQTMMQMAQLNQAGQAPMAQALRKMLEEMLNRFDERIDLDEFLPDMTPNPMQQMMQAMGGAQAPVAPQEQGQAIDPALQQALTGNQGVLSNG